jgi:SAM-dependent methyltransferase
MRGIRTQQDLDTLFRSARGYAVISLWSQTGLFELLSDGVPRSAEKLPGDVRALKIMAPILKHLGLLAGDEKTWTLTQTAKDLLEVGAFKGMNVDKSLGDLTRLEPVLNEGLPVKGPDGASRVSEGGVRESDIEGARGFMDYLYRRSEKGALEVARWMTPRLKPQSHVLDLGGGHGRYGAVLTEHGHQVTLYDRPVCVQVAKERYEDRLNYQVGDFLNDDLGGPYDAALLSNIVHGLGPEENVTVFKSLARSLNPGGFLVLKDMYLDPRGSDPENAVFFGMTMLMYTREGQTYTVDEMAQFAAQAGLKLDATVHVPDMGYSLLFVEKPSA